MRLIVNEVYSFGKNWKKYGEKMPFFWVAMAGLGKYSMGVYGQIGVLRLCQLFACEEWSSPHRHHPQAPHKEPLPYIVWGNPESGTDHSLK